MNEDNLTFQTHFSQAEDFKSKGWFEQAIAEYKLAIEAEPQSDRAHLGLGVIYRIKTETEPLYVKPAMHHLKEAIRLNPQNEEAHNQYILLSCRQGTLAAVHEEYIQLCINNPTDPILKACRDRLNIMVTTTFEQTSSENKSVANRGKSGFTKFMTFASWGLL